MNHGTIITFGKYNGYNTLDLLQSTAGTQYLGWGAENLSSPKWRQAFRDALNTKAEDMGNFREGQFISNVRYARVFESVKTSKIVSIPCDANGSPLNKTGRDYNEYLACVGNEAYWDLGVQESDNSYTTPASVRCGCGTWVTLDDSWANECHNCHQAYSGNGQRLSGI